MVIPAKAGMTWEMRYPFLLPCLALIAGIILETQVRIPLEVYVLTLSGLLPVVWLARGSAAFRANFILLIFLLSAINYRITSIPPPDDVSRIPLEGAVHSTVTGVVDGSVRRVVEGRSVRQTFPLAVRSIRVADKTFSARGRIQCITYQTDKRLRYGDYVRMWGSISAPKRATNPGEFDYALYLSRQGIYRQMSTVGEKSVTIVTPGRAHTLGTLTEAVRSCIAERFDAFLNKTESALLKALIIGDRRDIPFRIQEGFVHTGTVHVLSISGLHIAIVGGFWYAFWKMLGLAQRLNAALTILVIIFYMQIAGFNIPVIRSALMGALFYTAILIRKEGDSLNALFLAAFLLLAANPLWFFSISFQLSFLCVLSIVMFSPSFERGLRNIRWSPLRRSLSVSAATIVGAQVLITFYFSTITPISAVANFFIVPLITFITVGGFIFLALSYLPVAGPLAAYALAVLIRGSIFLNEQISKIPFAYWYVPRPHLGFVLGYYFLLSALWFLRPWLRHRRVGIWMTGLVTLAVVIMGWSFRGGAYISVTALDVKQAGVYLIRTPDRRHILVNSGPARKPDAGRWVTVPFLKSRGIRKLDAVVLTGWGKRLWGSLPDIGYFFRVSYCLIPAAGNIPREISSGLGRTEITKMKREFSVSGFEPVELRTVSSADGETAILISWNEINCLIIPSATGEIWKRLDHFNEDEDIDAVFIFRRNDSFSSEALSILANLKPRLIVISGSARPQSDPDFPSHVTVLYTRENGAVELEARQDKFLVKPFLGMPIEIA